MSKVVFYIIQVGGSVCVLEFNVYLVAAVISMTFIYKERLTCLKRFIPLRNYGMDFRFS